MYFVSYSRVDGGDLALALADELEAGPPPHRAWVDVRELTVGREDWDDQIVEAIKSASALLFVMSVDSVRVGSGCKYEWVFALKYKKPVIPLRLDRDASLPFRLSSRQFVDFSEGFEPGLARLRSHLRWMASPEGELQELRNRLSDAERELPRVPPEQRPRIENEVEELRRRIEQQRRAVEDPTEARGLTEARVASGLERERQPEQPAMAPVRAKFVNPPPMLPPSYFQGREAETRLLADFVRSDELRMMSVVGRGGVGKTAIVCRLLKALEGGRLPDDLGKCAAESIVYLSPVGAHPVSFANLFTDLCRVLPERAAERLLARYQDPLETPTSLMLSLLEAIGMRRTLVLLDNFEDLLDAATFEITDTALSEALHTFLRAPVHGVKVIATTRSVPRPLLLVEPARQRTLNLERGLDTPYAEDILRAMDPDGSLGLRDAPDALLASARERTRGFPRALEALVAILASDRESTLDELVSDKGPLPENVVEALVGEAFSRLDSVSQRIMQVLAIYTVPVPAVAVDFVLQRYDPAIDSAPLLRGLVDRRFARRDAARFYLHQVDRDYALQKVELGKPSDRVVGSPPPFTQYGLRRRAADYFAQTRTPRQTWRNLDDLAPQLAEFELRVQADDYDAAAEILGSISWDYLNLWGHHRHAADLHERLEGLLADPRTHAGNLYGLACCYQALGDTERSIALLEAMLEIALDLEDRALETSALIGLDVCYSDHLGDAERAITFAQRALAVSQEAGNRASEGAALANLASDTAALGDSRTAVRLMDQAIAIARETGYERGEAHRLVNLGIFKGDLGDWQSALQHCSRAVEIADKLGYVQICQEARLELAKAHLCLRNFEAARDAATAAREHEYALRAPDTQLLLGIATAHTAGVSEAKPHFRDATLAADALVRRSAMNVKVLDTRALARCGLALGGNVAHARQAAADFRSARAVASAPGDVQRVIRLFDLLTEFDSNGALREVRGAIGHDAQ